MISHLPAAGRDVIRGFWAFSEISNLMFIFFSS